MGLHVIKKGLDIPISGEPQQRLDEAPAPRHVAVMGYDFVGMRPRMAVEEGDTVRRGQLLFEDKKTPEVRHTAPGAGTVAAINRGERRALQSVVIELDEGERTSAPGDDLFEPFETFNGGDPAALDGARVRALLLESGMWTAIRRRPFSRTANPEDAAGAIFVNAMDTNPLAASPDVVAADAGDALDVGLACLGKLVDGPLFFCKAAGSELNPSPSTGARVEEFRGPHPAGTVGLHIHTLFPVNRDRTVWHLDYQDAIAIGRLFRTGRLDVERVISVAGPRVERPRLLRTRRGASLDEILEGELREGGNRVISGSVLNGRAAMGEVHGYLGRYHAQVSALEEGNERVFLGWMAPGFNAYSVTRAFASSFLKPRRYALTTAVNGSPRAIVPMGYYERVMPMDILPTFLLRKLCGGDIEGAEQLGCLELDEEDLALCSFVCPGKNDYGLVLRQRLTEIEKEG